MTWVTQIVEISCFTDLEILKKKPEIKLLAVFVPSLDWSIFILAYHDLSLYIICPNTLWWMNVLLHLHLPLHVPVSLLGIYELGPILRISF